MFGPRMVEHSFRVTSAEARFLLLLTPAGFEDFTRTCRAPATTLTIPPPDLASRDIELLASAARTHGIDIIDPS